MELLPGQVIKPTTTSAWIEPNGTFHYVPECGHYLVAVGVLGDLTGGDELQAKGWVHFSFTGVHHLRPLTQAQRDTLWDTWMAFEEATEPVAYKADYIQHLGYAVHEVD